MKCMHCNNLHRCDFLVLQIVHLMYDDISDSDIYNVIVISYDIEIIGSRVYGNN